MKLTQNARVQQFARRQAQDSTAKSKWAASVAILIALLLYALGIQWPLTVVVLILSTVFLPMPRIFSSWFSRTIVAVFIVLALLQISAALQFIAYPAGRFGVTAVVLASLTLVAVWLSGTYRPVKQLPVLNRMDVFAAVGCLVFLMPFVSVIGQSNSVAKISQIADSQVVDSVTHYRILSDFLGEQHLHYKVGVYYPSGFHDATAFVEHSFDPGILQNSWKAHVWQYFLQYAVGGMLLCYTFIYFIYGMIRLLGIKTTTPMLAVIGVTAGFLITIMHLLLFMQAGFLNFYYICATLLMALQYLLETDDSIEAKKTKQSDFTWHVTYYLILCAGAALSWPLFVPITLLPAAIIVLPKLIRIRRVSVIEIKTFLPIAVAGLFNLLALYFQLKYTVGGQNVNATGAIHNFNVLFLAIGMGSLLLALFLPQFVQARRRLVLVYTPYILLILGLMMLQYFSIGAPEYYLIKSAMLLEMLFLALLITIIFYLFTRNLGSSFAVSLAPASIVLAFIVVTTMGSVPQPFYEIRALFRGHSHFPSPRFMYEDSKSVAKLGEHGKITNYNLAVMHYNQTTKKIFAQPEISYWANSLAVIRPFAAGTVEADDYSVQFAALAYNAYGDNSQQQLIKYTNGCIAASRQQHLPYFIVTDSGSVAYLKQLFGDMPTYVVK